VTATGNTLPIKPFVKLPPVDAPNAAPYLAGLVCNECKAILVDGTSRLACPKCGGRQGFTQIKLAETGSLYNYTVVERSFPGVLVPFVSVIVDLDGGGTLKGNLRKVKPEKIKFGMPVRVVFDEAGRTDKNNNSYVSYFFEPVEEEARV